MYDGLGTLAFPMAGIVIEKLHHPADQPKEADPTDQPATEVVCARGQFAGEPNRHHAENHQRDGDEPRVHVEHLPYQLRHPRHRFLPLHDAYQEEVQHGDGQLRGRGDV